MKKIAVGSLLVATALTGCADMSHTKKGTMIGAGSGAAAGALLGQVIGRDTNSTLIGAGAGAAAGALAGGMIGVYMDKQEAAMRQQLGGAKGVTIKRNGNDLEVIFKSDLLFPVGSADVNEGMVDELAQFSKVVKDYPQTTIVVMGHTDSTGGADMNQRLSERRAKSVKEVLVEKGVESSRLSTVGYGETKPVADNSTDAGRMKNRRVDIKIRPIQQS